MTPLREAQRPYSAQQTAPPWHFSKRGVAPRARRRSLLGGVVVWLAACTIAGCTRGIAPPKITSDELEAAQSQRAAELIEDRIEITGALRAIEFDITTNAADFCPGLTTPSLGAVLGSAESFRGKFAKQAARETGLNSRVSVLHVVGGGPLDLAGVSVGDVVIAANGKDIQTRAELLSSLGTSSERVSLRIARRGEPMDVTVKPLGACPVKLQYVQSSQLLPAALGRTTASVPRGMLKLFPEASERAILIGHQLAHLLFDRSDDSELERERRADRLGLFLTARAGYDVSQAVSTWERITFEHPWLASPPSPDRYRNYPHQWVAMRMSAIRETVAEIEVMVDSGQPLIPTDP